MIRGTNNIAAISAEAWETIRGGYDLHVHVLPDVIARRVDDLDLAKEFLAHGLRGFVLKSHYVPTAERAKVVAKAVPGIAAYGSLTLNHAVGGLNPVAVEIAGRSGCKIVWMPTVDAGNEAALLSGGAYKKLPFWAEIQHELTPMGTSPSPLTVLDDRGKISHPVSSCLEVIAQHDMILATGHLARHEIFLLVKAAREMKVRKVIVTHADFMSQNLSADEQVELVGMGAFIEHCFNTMHSGKASWEVALTSTRRVGADCCIASTDLGQPSNPPVADGFAMFAQKLLDSGFSSAEVRRMTVTNPAALIE
jgi:hypothetical protein